jgi:hypothetical protein
MRVVRERGESGMLTWGRRWSGGRRLKGRRDGGRLLLLALVGDLALFSVRVLAGGCCRKYVGNGRGRCRGRVERGSASDAVRGRAE